MDPRFAIARRRHGGFTLVELLVVIAIIAILASFVLGAIFSSQEHAKGTRTERTITILHNALMDEWEGYRLRRLPIRKGFLYNPSTKAETPAAESDAAWQLRRLAALRQLMRMEMPDRYEDLLFTPTVAEPALRKSYLRKLDTFRAKYNAANGTSLNAAAYADLIEDTHESAECLYLIMTSGPEQEDRLQLKGRDIGDVDQDGVPEILDGWGRPVHFLRWAPGFVSDLQTVDAAGLPDPMDNHDQFDPLKLAIGKPSDSSVPQKNPPPLNSGEPAPAAWGFAIVPLIFSAGPDGEYGIYELPQEGTPTAIIADKNNNPYSKYDNSVDYVWRGEPNTSPDITHLDNIHNHLLGTR